MLRDRQERRTALCAPRKTLLAHTTSAGQGQQGENAKHGLSRAARWQLHPNRTGTLEYACGSLGRPRHRRHAMRDGAVWFEGSKRLSELTQVIDVDARVHEVLGGWPDMYTGGVDR